MLFGSKTLAQLSVDDLQALVAEGAKEDDTLEYKRDMYGTNDEAVREMLRDLSSMANHRGGHLIVGMDEDEEGAASELVGVDKDDHVGRIRSSYLSNIARRLNNVEVESIDLSSGRDAIVIRIPQSLTGPHMVTFKGLNQFWRRHGRQKERMTIDEIHQAFERQFEMETRHERFITDRRRRFVERANRMGIHGAWLFLYATPLSLRDEIVDIHDDKIRSLMYLRVPRVQNALTVDCGYAPMPSLEGLRSEDRGDGNLYCYLEVHRTGHVEHATREFLKNLKEWGNAIPSVLAALAIVDFTYLLAQLYEYLKVSVPVLVGFSIFNAGGLALAAEKRIGDVRWEEQHLEIPPRYVADIVQEHRLVAKELNDRLWNAFQLESCDFFDEKGEWVYRG